jgi:trans-aconitate 2-methyltransferase
MPSWQSEQYLKFEEERTRPCRDLAANIHAADPRRVIDLGCGPGNSTAVLAQRWPSASIAGLDNSQDMLNRARKQNPDCEWIHADITAWLSEPAVDSGLPYDVVFSNAALQWVPDHGGIFPRLMSRVAEGGCLAVQMPANIDAPAHQQMRDLAGSDAWRDRFPEGGVREWYVHGVNFYYDVLASVTSRIDLWETTYFHVLQNVEAIAEWYRGTGLRPFLDHLSSEAERLAFVWDYVELIRPEYPERADGRVLFPFKRLFLVASKEL